MRQAPIGPSFKLRHGCDCPLPPPRFGLNSSTGRATTSDGRLLCVDVRFWGENRPAGRTVRLLSLTLSGGWGMSAIQPLWGDKQTSGERVATAAFDPDFSLPLLQKHQETLATIQKQGQKRGTLLSAPHNLHVTLTVTLVI